MRGWETKTIGDACTIVNGGTPKTGVSEYWDGEHLWITPAEMGKRPSPYADDTARKLTDKGLEDCSAKLLPPHSVILSSRAPIGHLVINTAPMATNQGCKGLIPGRALDHKFLFYYLGSIVDHLNDLGTGATFKELSGGKLKEVGIPLPPLDEQRRIVAILDEAFAGLAVMRQHAEANLKNARALFDSHLNAIFSQRGDGWVETTLEDAVSPSCSLSYGIVQPGDEFADGLPVVRPTDLGKRIIGIETLKRIDPKLADGYQRTLLHGGELLLCVRGTTGVISVASMELAGGNVTRGIVPVVFARERVNQAFGYFLMRSKPVQDQIRDNTYGAALMQINIGDLRKINVRYPSLKLQGDLVGRLNTTEIETTRLESLYRQKLAAIDELKQSILHRAFSGQLTGEAIAA